MCFELKTTNLPSNPLNKHCLPPIHPSIHLPNKTLKSYFPWHFISSKIAQKKFFKFAPKCWSKVLFPPKHKNAYFNQHLECTAPKCWLKYTTPNFDVLNTNFRVWNSKKVYEIGNWFHPLYLPFLPPSQARDFIIIKDLNKTCKTPSQTRLIIFHYYITNKTKQ